MEGGRKPVGRQPYPFTQQICFFQFQFPPLLFILQHDWKVLQVFFFRVVKYRTDYR